MQKAEMPKVRSDDCNWQRPHRDTAHRQGTDDHDVSYRRNNEPCTWARVPQMLAFANGIEGSFAAEHKDYRGEGLERADVEPELVFPYKQRARTEPKKADS